MAAEERRSMSKFVMMKVMQSLAPEGDRAECVLKAEFAADGERLRQGKVGTAQPQCGRR